MIKNAIVYQVLMPMNDGMLEFTKEHMSNKPDIGQVSTIGFTKHPITGEVVSAFQGGYCLTIQIWEKKLDNTAIKAEVNNRVESYELDLERKLTKKEHEGVKDDVICHLLLNILPTPKIVFAYYNGLTQHLFIDSPSNKVCDSVTSLLRKAIGSLKATALYIDASIGLTQQVVDCLDLGEHDLVDKLVHIKDSLELKGDQGDSVKFKNVNLFDSSEEIIDQINDASMYVKSINLDFGNTLNFNYVDGAKFTGIKFIDFEVPDTGEEQDRNHDWLCETVYAVTALSRLTTTLCNHFTVVEE